MQTQDISTLNLFLSLLFLLIPGCILFYYRTKITIAMVVSIVRMVVQLFLVGFYLKYIFEWNNPWINITWLFLMIGVCAIDLINRLRMSFKNLFTPVSFSIILSLLLVVLPFFKLVIGLNNLFESRYFIPITGIVLGNILSTNVIGLSAFFTGIEHQQQTYNYLLCNGATMPEATKPFIRDALVKSFNPTIASMAVMGLISLPGTLTGQIIGGNAPDIAIHYQIAIMVLVVTTSSISLLISLIWTKKFMFDEYGRFKASFVKDKDLL